MRTTTTGLPFRLPAKYLPIYEQGRADARAAREAGNHRTQVIAAWEAEKKERERVRKEARTMEIARQRTADRLATQHSYSLAAASS